VTTTRLVDRYEPLLGTVVEVRLELDGDARDDEAATVSATVADEIVRLQSILSSVDSASEFSRWCRGEVTSPSPDLVEVLALTAEWQRRSAGRVNPAVGRLSDLWRAAEDAGVEPDDATLAAVVADIAPPRWSVVDGRVTRLADTTGCTLNAVAKGWIADRAADLATGLVDAALVAVNAGGDIAVRGRASLTVGIEDPATPWDNAPPLTVLALPAGGLATSGGARRGFRIDGVWHSHVFDPRTGRPAQPVASLSVIAPTTAEADALATMLGVTDPDDAHAEAESLDVACLLVTDDGRTLTTTRWRALEVS